MKHALLILSVFFANAAMCQSMLKGTVKDASTSEALVGATVYIKAIQKGDVADMNGNFSFAVPNGNYVLEVAFMGYETQKIDVVVPSSKNLIVKLKNSVENLSSVEITEVKTNRNIVVNEMGHIDLSIKAIKQIPTLLGEVDVIKAIQLLPGIMSTQEGGSGFTVRGGAPDQNLIILDDATSYNASHALGFFSVFNNDAIKNVSIYKGDIPLQFGGRLSSLLDITMEDGSEKAISGQGGIGILSSRIALKGSLFNKKTNYLIAGRRTYFDIFFPLAKNEQLKGTKLYFWDINAKITQRLGEKDNLSMSFYTGIDKFIIGNPYIKSNYGNMTGTIGWSHIFSKKLTSKLNAVYSDYSYDMGAEISTIRADWSSRITDVGLKYDWVYLFSEENELRWGYQSFYHHFLPGEADIIIGGLGEWISDSAMVNKHQKLPPVHAWENAVYASHNWKINDHFGIKYGLRFSTFTNIGKDKVYYYDDNYKLIDIRRYYAGEFYHTSYGLEPRVGFNYVIDKKQSIKVNYSRNFQYLQLAQNSNMGNPLDVWFPTNPNIKPQIADMVALGYFRNFVENEWETSAEIYYKHIHNCIDFKEHSNVMMNEQLYGEIRTGIARSYGLEVMIKKNSGMFNGWISYTLSRAERKIEEINEGTWYLSPYDRTHNLTLVLNVDIHPQHSISANFVYYTGNAVTFPSGKAYINGTYIPVYTERNGYRMPDYHRLDFSYTFRGKQRKYFNYDINVGVYNLYNKHNAWMIQFQQDRLNPDQTYAEKWYLFGIVPSITFNFKF
jgi:hypothetical protein